MPTPHHTRRSHTSELIGLLIILTSAVTTTAYALYTFTHALVTQ